MGAVKFPTDFVERTRDLVESYSGNSEFTHLLNCTLGLLILPFEHTRNSQAPDWSTPVNEFARLHPFTLHIFEPLRSNKGGRKEYYPKTVDTFLRKLRDGLAHQHIEPVNQDGTWVGVRIRNHYGSTLDTDVEFTYDQLRSFALYIADEFIRTQ